MSGPVDGHDLETLVPILQNVRDAKQLGPVLVHVVTEKGKGHPFSKPDKERYHAVSGFDPETLELKQDQNQCSDLHHRLRQGADRRGGEGQADRRHHGGHGVGHRARQVLRSTFPDRMFDVGIAEQHAVTFAAGLAAEGFKPFCAIYSTFLQRAYDQIVHDVALQRLPVRFAIDRAGLVGQDGATHAGSYDISYLACLPDFVIMAASDEAELVHMVATAAAIDDGPVRLPLSARRRRRASTCRKSAFRSKSARAASSREGSKVAHPVARRAAAGMPQGSRRASPRTAFRPPWPMPASPSRSMKRWCGSLIRKHEVLITIEEGAIGGFGSHVLNYLASNDLLGGRLKVRSMFLPDRFIGHGTPREQFDEAGLEARHVVNEVFAALKHAGANVLDFKARG